MSGKLFPNANIDTEVRVGVTWAIHALRSNAVARVLRCALLVQRYEGAGYVSRAVLTQDYHRLFSLSRFEAKRDIDLFINPVSIGDDKMMRIGREVLHRGKLVLKRHSFKREGRLQGFRDLGTFVIKMEALRSLVTFRIALYEGILLSFTRPGEEGLTISRQGLSKILQISENSQRRYEKSLSLQIRKNIAFLPDEQSLPTQRQDLRIATAPAVQIRSTVIVEKPTYVTQVRSMVWDSPEVTGNAYAPAVSSFQAARENAPAQAIEQVDPFAYHRVARQTFSLSDMDLMKNGVDYDQDMFIGTALIGFGWNEESVCGLYVRKAANHVYDDGQLMTVVKQIEQFIETQQALEALRNDDIVPFTPFLRHTTRGHDAGSFTIALSPESKTLIANIAAKQRMAL